MLQFFISFQGMCHFGIFKRAFNKIWIFQIDKSFSKCKWNLWIHFFNDRHYPAHFTQRFDNALIITQGVYQGCQFSSDRQISAFFVFAVLQIDSFPCPWVKYVLFSQLLINNQMLHQSVAIFNLSPSTT